ncbi:MAG: 3-hydroxyacyl-CoA dehydrogenase family protein [Syntrophobacteraceae bacterium]
MELHEIKRIGVLGAGLMGHGIAQVFASAGYGVNIFDVDEACLGTVKDRIAENFKVLMDLGLASPVDAGACVDRITLCPSIETLCRDVQYIIEAVREDPGTKKEIISEVERFAAADTIISSNTSAISITEISTALENKGRFLGTHFWNPPHVLPCVEVIKGGHTDDAIFGTVFSLMEKVGKAPVRVLRDVPGFLGNRLQHAMWREAISLCEKGIATAEDIDNVVKFGFGLRLAFIGPLETADLASLSLTHDIQKYLFPYLDASQQPSPLLSKLVTQGASGVKAGRGFYDWTPEKVRGIIESRDKVLLRILREIVSPHAKTRVTKAE